MTMQRWLLPCEGRKRQCAKKKKKTHITIVTHSTESRACHILSLLLEAVLIRKPFSFSLLSNASIFPLPTQTQAQVPLASLNKEKKNNFFRRPQSIVRDSTTPLFLSERPFSAMILSIITINSPVRCGRRTASWTTVKSWECRRQQWWPRLQLDSGRLTARIR